MLRYPCYRGCSAAQHYRGPQGYGHRGEAARMLFTFALAEPPRQPRLAPGLPETACFLMCSKCMKFRRVDAATRLVFSNKEWMQAALREDMPCLFEAVPAFTVELDTYLGMVRAAGSDAVQAGHFWAFLDIVGLGDSFQHIFDGVVQTNAEEGELPPAEASIVRQFNVLQRFMEVASLLELRTHSDGLQGMYETLENALPGVLFRCDALVWSREELQGERSSLKLPCDVPCDWQRAFDVFHDMSGCANMGGELLLGYCSQRGVEFSCVSARDSVCSRS